MVLHLFIFLRTTSAHCDRTYFAHFELKKVLEKFMYIVKKDQKKDNHKNTANALKIRSSSKAEQSEVQTLFYYPLYDLSNNSLIVISDVLAEMSSSLSSICH